MSLIILGEMPQAVACLDAISRSVTLRRMTPRGDDASSENSSVSSAVGGRGLRVGAKWTYLLTYKVPHWRL